nr:hypothetical protein BaRGS_000044 [Batillaria attramentaria]
MLSVFLLAKVTRRKFKIDMRTPCNVTNFLHPVTEDWWSWERDMTTDSRVVLDDMRGAILAHVLQAGYDVNTRFPHTVVYVRTTRDLVPVLSQHPLYRNLLPTWAGTTSQATRFRLGWNLLAAPTRSLQQRLHTAMAPRSVHARNHISNGSLVCAHLRMGHNPTMPEDWNIRNNASAVQLVFTFLEDVLEVVNHSYVFVATDDHGVRVAARERFGLRLVDSGGTIVHIDRQNSRLDACAGFESTIVDQLVLSTCRVLVISRSGFSRHAAYLRHKTDGLFILHQGAITPYNLA